MEKNAKNAAFDALESFEVENLPENELDELFLPEQENSNGGFGEFSAFDEADILEQLESKFESSIALDVPENKSAKISVGRGVNLTVSESPNAETVNVQEMMSEEMVEISAEMYVEMLEAATEAICQWVSGIDKKYLFRNGIKDRYKRVSEKMLRYSNVKITPAHLFAIMTIFVVWSPLQQANKDRLKKKKQKDGGETHAKSVGMFTEVESGGEVRTNFAVVKDGGMYYYKNTPSGEYSKKGTRESVESELGEMIESFYQNNGKWPKISDIQKIKTALAA